MISEITVNNFRSIVAGQFQFSQYTPLVGYNNAGKTNILSALIWAIRKSSLDEEDFFDPDAPVVITATLSGIVGDVLDSLEEVHRKKIEPLVTDGRFKIRRTQRAPNAAAKDIRLEVLRHTEEGEEQWVPNPSGIDQAIKQIFPEPIFIGAMENATEDVGKFGAGTTIGKLIKAIIQPVTDTYAAPVTEALENVAAKLSADSPEKDATLVSLDVKIQNELKNLFPGLQAKTHIPTPQFEDFLRGATIRIFEEGYGTQSGQDAGSFGHGAQRSIQIALVKCLDGVNRAAQAGHSRTTLLLIDEPELYLHPQAVEMVRASLRRLAGYGYQVVFSTHSSGMISRHDAANTLLIRRSAATGTRAYPRIKDAVSASIDAADHQSQTLFELSNATKILFSERVLLAEGKTEQMILPEIYATVRQRTLEEDRLGLVSLGGSSNIPAALAVLTAMGVPSKALVDLDFAFKEAQSAGLLPEKSTPIDICKSELKKLEEAGQVTLDEQGLPKKGQTGSAAEGYEKLAASQAAEEAIADLHELLRSEGVWLWRLGAIEAHLGIAAKTNAARLQFLISLAQNGLADAARDHKEIEKLVTWIGS